MTFRGAPLAPLLNAYGRPNPERSPLPLLKVLLLLTGENQEEGDGASEREGGTSGVRNQGSFFVVPGGPTSV